MGTELSRESHKAGIGFLLLYITGFERVIKSPKEKHFEVDSPKVASSGLSVKIGRGYCIDHTTAEIRKLSFRETAPDIKSFIFHYFNITWSHVHKNGGESGHREAHLAGGGLTETEG